MRLRTSGVVKTLYEMCLIRKCRVFLVCRNLSGNPRTNGMSTSWDAFSSQ